MKEQQPVPACTEARHEHILAAAGHEHIFGRREQQYLLLPVLSHMSVEFVI